MSVVLVKPGVEFSVIAPGGFRMLGAIERTARELGCSLTITSACDGTHSGPDDPHHRGEAYDLRTHDLPADVRAQVLMQLMADLAVNADDAPLPTSGGFATGWFFGWIEHPGENDEHLHVQVRKGRSYGA